MDYLLDTNACIAIINGEPAAVRVRLQKELSAGARILVSSIALFELWYGVGKSAKQEFNRKRLEAFLSGPIVVLPFEDADSLATGSLRASLEAIRKPIGAYDLLIAGQALRQRARLVTSDVAEFSRLRNLDWEDWARP